MFPICIKIRSFCRVRADYAKFKVSKYIHFYRFKTNLFCFHPIVQCENTKLQKGECATCRQSEITKEMKKTRMRKKSKGLRCAVWMHLIRQINSFFCATWDTQLLQQFILLNIESSCKYKVSFMMMWKIHRKYLFNWNNWANLKLII